MSSFTLIKVVYVIHLSRLKEFFFLFLIYSGTSIKRRAKELAKRAPYYEVSLHRGSFSYIFCYCWCKKNRSLYRGLRYIEVRYIKVGYMGVRYTEDFNSLYRGSLYRGWLNGRLRYV